MQKPRKPVKRWQSLVQEQKPAIAICCRRNKKERRLVQLLSVWLIRFGRSLPTSLLVISGGVIVVTTRAAHDVVSCIGNCRGRRGWKFVLLRAQLRSPPQLGHREFVPPQVLKGAAASLNPPLYHSKPSDTITPTII